MAPHFGSTFGGSGNPLVKATPYDQLTPMGNQKDYKESSQSVKFDILQRTR